MEPLSPIKELRASKFLLSMLSQSRYIADARDKAWLSDLAL